MKPRRIGIGLLLATANTVVCKLVLPISGELYVKESIEEAVAGATTESIDSHGV
jgi:hypothetical protein